MNTRGSLIVTRAGARTTRSEYQPPEPRRSKSISRLVQEFLKELELSGTRFFSVDYVRGVCDMHGFSERRAYDILIILESFGLIQKFRCSTFFWMGFEGFAWHMKNLPHFIKLNARLHNVCKAVCQIITQKRIGLSAKLILKYLPSNDLTVIRRVYDVVNVLKCFPDYLKLL